MDYEKMTDAELFELLKDNLLKLEDGPAEQFWQLVQSGLEICNEYEKRHGITELSPATPLEIQLAEEILRDKM